MLTIQNLHVSIEKKEILKDVSMEFTPGENVCILGKNGSGKSSLALTTMGHPQYEVTKGSIQIDGTPIHELDAHERAQLGIFLAFQTIPEIKGVKLFEFLRTIYSEKVGKNVSFVQFKKIVTPYLDDLDIDKEFLWRDLNVGFSGGERRKVEILQLKLLEPTYIFLDEVDSGLDVDAFRQVAELMKELDNEKNCFIIITHYFTILDHLPVDRVIVLQNGSIQTTGDTAMAMEIKTNGFSVLKK